MRLHINANNVKFSQCELLGSLLVGRLQCSEARGYASAARCRQTVDIHSGFGSDPEKLAFESRHLFSSCSGGVGDVDFRMYLSTYQCPEHCPLSNYFFYLLHK